MERENNIIANNPDKDKKPIKKGAKIKFDDAMDAAIHNNPDEEWDLVGGPHVRFPGEDEMVIQMNEKTGKHYEIESLDSVNEDGQPLFIVREKGEDK